MNHKIIFKLLLIGCILSFSTQLKAKNSFGRQMFKNLNLGWDANHTSNYRSSNFHFGTAYGQKFEHNAKASWQVGADLNWSKYTIYSDGAYRMNSTDDILRTRSLSIPFTVGYEVSKTFFHGMKVYTGPSYEMIFSPTLNGNHYSDLRAGQWGWTVGTKVRFLAIISARVALNYYPTGLFANGNLNRTALSFSIGF